MARYTFTFKKDDIFVEFSTDEKQVVEKQFRIWVNAADVYTKIKEQGGYNGDFDSLKNTSQEFQELEKTENVNQNFTEHQPIPHPPENHETQTVVQSDVQSEQQEIFETNTVEETVNPEPAQDYFEPVNTINEIQNPTQPDFDKILENRIDNSTYEPKFRTDERFSEMVRAKNISERIDYFIATAYYLSNVENLDRFNLKQINAKLMQNFSMVIDHGILQQAMDIGFVEIVPDYTGFAQAVEYRLTESGEGAFLNGRY